jgi:N-acetylmuramoyl-L-alanine amidase
MRRKWLRLFAVLSVVWALQMSGEEVSPRSVPTAEAFTARKLVYGSQGNDVYELQNRLRYVGFYRGKIDGVFGWKTYWAVRNFQYQFGLRVTGVVDHKTKKVLVKASAGWRHKGSTGHRPGNTGFGGAANVPVVQGLSQSDLQLMQHVVYGEARGEPYRGEVAIAAVILNRLRDPRFPHTVPGIVYQPGAFTAVEDGQVNLQPDSQAMRAVLDAVHGWDPTHGAVYYFNPATATSSWIWSRPQLIQIGKHIFCM